MIPQVQSFNEIDHVYEQADKFLVEYKDLVRKYVSSSAPDPRTTILLSVIAEYSDPYSSYIWDDANESHKTS